MRAPRVAFLLALLIATSTPALGATTRVGQVSNADSNEAVWMRQFDAPAVAVADFDGDGRKEIVAHNDNQNVYVFSAGSSRILAEFRTEYPAGWTVRPINDPAVADVDGDGRLEIVVVNSAAVVCVYEHDPAGSTSTSLDFDKRWCKRMDAYDGGTAAADAGAKVADVDGDGKMEIFSQTEKVGLFAFNHDGSVRWSKATYGGNAGPLVEDLDGDGRKEVVFFGDGGEVKAFDASSGSSKWSFWASNYVRPASIPVAGNAADLDGDGRKEVVFTARDAPAGDSFYDDNHLMVFVLSSSGSLKARWQPTTWANPLSYTHPVLLDVNGDGKRDILLQDWNTIGHKPGNWERLGNANVFAYTASGTLLWRTELDNSWSNDDLAVADVDGDGAQEVLALGWGPSGDGVWYLDLRTGAKETHVPVGSWTALRGAVAGNLLGDGKTSWAISVHSSQKGGAFQTYRTDAACNVAFGGWQIKDPCGGGSGGDPPPTPPGGLATFTPTGGNEWWVQVKVAANAPLSGVDARVNGGSWKPLTLRSWGDWAASVHAPEGAIVQFQARAASGEVVASGCYQWTARASVACDGAPPPSGSFDATFSGVRGNEWWVETNVAATGGTLAGVDARVNGGDWVALTKRSWGSWAKSIHAPPGSTVELRARATDGQTDVSPAYAWPPG